MFTGVAINANPYRRQLVHALAVESRMLLLGRATDSYPSETDLKRLCSLAAPDVLILDVENPEETIRCLDEVQRRYPDTPVIGLGGTPAQRRTLSFSGVKHFIDCPPDIPGFVDVLSKAIRDLHSHRLPHLCAFVPAKAGCGASTVAVFTAGALAALPDSRVLFIDTDLRSSVVSLMLDVEPRGTVQGALRSAYEMDVFRWRASVTHQAGIDYLLSSGNMPNPAPEWSHYFGLLRFAENMYNSIVADLPELVNPATEEVLRRAGAVYVVTTQEPIVVAMAAKRCAELVRWGAGEDRIQVVVNRWHSREMPAARIQEAIGRPVAFTIPNSYDQVRTSLRQAQIPPAPKSDLGKAFLQMAYAMKGKTAQPVETQGLGGLLRGLVSRG
jgi:pilus assembly protein CpaE